MSKTLRGARLIALFFGGLTVLASAPAAAGCVSSDPGRSVFGFCPDGTWPTDLPAWGSLPSPDLDPPPPQPPPPPTDICTALNGEGWFTGTDGFCAQQTPTVTAVTAPACWRCRQTKGSPTPYS